MTKSNVKILTNYSTNSRLSVIESPGMGFNNKHNLEIIYKIIKIARDKQSIAEKNRKTS